MNDILVNTSVPFQAQNDSKHENLFFQVYELLNDIHNHKCTLDELGTCLFSLDLVMILEKLIYEPLFLVEMTHRYES